METIGQLLKEKREFLGLSLEDMSEKTKLSSIQLNAIEKGDISFFKDDLSYLSYFVRYYAQALGVDYNEIKDTLNDSINDFNDTISMKKVETHEEINRNILHKTSRSNRKMRIDLSSLFLVLASVLVFILLVFTFIKFIVPTLQSKDPIEAPVIVLPDDEVEKDQQEDKPVEDKPAEEPELKEVKLKELEPKKYEIYNWNDELEFKLKIDNRAWIRFSVDNVILDEPTQGIYEQGEEISVLLTPQVNQVLSLNIGYMRGNQVFIDDTELVLNEDIANSQAGIVLEFIFVEGDLVENEYSE